MSAMLPQGFDASQVEPSKAFEPLPAGKYKAVIIESDTQPTKAGTGSFLKLVFQVVEGEHAKRQLTARLNLNNPNRQAVEIAMGELSAICRAVGVLTPQQSGELHHKPLTIAVKCRKRTDNGEITNEISGYEPVGLAGSQAAGSQPGTAPATAPSAATAEPSKAPW